MEIMPMSHLTPYIREVFERHSYPEEAVKLFTEFELALDSNPAVAEIFDPMVENYMDSRMNLGDALKQAAALGKILGFKEQTSEFMFVLNCTELLRQNYILAGIPDEIFWNSQADLKYKLMECIECEGVPGTFVAGWNNGYLRMRRFAYGRFQYELSTYDWEKEFVTSCGKVLKPGDTYINFHIPSSGVPLTDEVRMDSYRQAYKVVAPLFPDGKVIFGCGSWLLYPRHREFLPERLNIRRFMDDFEIVGWAEKDSFGNDWRVFGHYSDLPCTEWPRDTALRKAYAEWICAGNKAGDAFGVFVFDGEKILR